jgi:hypothetical protein
MYELFELQNFLIDFLLLPPCAVSTAALSLESPGRGLIYVDLLFFSFF